MSNELISSLTPQATKANG